MENQAEEDQTRSRSSICASVRWKPEETATSGGRPLNSHGSALFIFVCCTLKLPKMNDVMVFLRCRLWGVDVDKCVCGETSAVRAQRSFRRTDEDEEDDGDHTVLCQYNQA